MAKISVIIPCYNEEKWIPELLKRVSSALEGLNSEIIFVDDGSTDGSVGDAFNSGVNLNHLIGFSKNEGKGRAIAEGLRYATGDIIIIQDADLEYNPENYKQLIQPILDGKTYVVYGSRWINSYRHYPGRTMFMIGNLLVTFIANILYRARLTDMSTGYKVFHREVLDKIVLESKGFEFCAEVTAKARRLGYTIMEVPIDYVPRTREQGKKIKFRDAIKLIWTLVKYK